MIWNDFQVIIPSVVSINERIELVKTILINLSKQCPGISATIVPQFKKENYSPRVAFESIQKGLCSINSNWVIYMEDDIILSPKFGEKILDVISLFNNDTGAISLFSYDVKDIQLYNSGIKLYEANYPFIYAQCFILKKEVALAWKDMVLDWWDNTKDKQSPDICFGDCCKSLNKKIMVYLPNLVQHVRTPSAFGHTIFAESSTYEFSKK